MFFYKKLGWSKLVVAQYDVFYELTIEFYTTLKILDENHGVFSCRFFGKENYFDYKIMSDIFSFPKGCICQPPL